MVIIGGLGSILGSFLGAAFILILPIMLDQVPHALGMPLSVETVSLPGVHRHRRADLLSADRRTTWLC